MLKPTHISMYRPKIKTFYNHKQVMETNIDKSESKSPLKPKLLLKYLKRLKIYDEYLELKTDFKPFVKSDFLIAHTEEYVEAVFKGIKPLCNSNWLTWSNELLTSVCWTNASLYNAMEYASQNPDTITYSLTSGFHHATPDSGMGFCTFSGQVIASVKLYRKYGLRTAYLDLDGHFGNSIENSREFVSDLNLAVPPGFNINPTGKNQGYINSLNKHLELLERAILNNEIDSVVWCHGADSHEEDDMVGFVNTKEWVECSTIFFNWVKQINIKRGKPLPVTITLFGGYRMDDFQNVLELHAADIIECLNILCGRNIAFTPDVRENSFRQGK